ncbi:synaptogyrin-3 isoform X2 [Amblyraja radiata]|uniref:synaptogyrin-3 isoform X2 n=1 Tax=Amblyraja radiata TaxID=386614 RepID=UPI001403839E|nr:synaptogyrin-3 isoform X2 [Amblyraja radiata]
MEGGAYGAGKAGSGVDPIAFLKQPQTILRILSWVFSIVVFASIVNEGYVNKGNNQLYCVFNKNDDACNYGISIGITAFFICVLYITLDFYFPQLSSIKDRKRVVMADLGLSGLWTFLWFVSFCFLANQWQYTPSENLPLNQGADAARAAVAFSFFSILSWGYLSLLAFDKLKNIGFNEDVQRLVLQSSPSSLV